MQSLMQLFRIAIEPGHGGREPGGDLQVEFY